MKKNVTKPAAVMMMSAMLAASALTACGGTDGTGAGTAAVETEAMTEALPEMGTEAAEPEMENAPFQAQPGMEQDDMTEANSDDVMDDSSAEDAAAPVLEEDGEDAEDAGAAPEFNLDEEPESVG